MDRRTVRLRGPFRVPEAEAADPAAWLARRFSPTTTRRVHVTWQAHRKIDHAAPRAPPRR